MNPAPEQIAIAKRVPYSWAAIAAGKIEAGDHHEVKP